MEEGAELEDYLQKRKERRANNIVASRFLSPDLTADQWRMVRQALSQTLGRYFDVEIGVANERMAISITPHVLTDKILVDLGMQALDTQPGFADSIKKVFQAVLGREPSHSEIVINNHRLLDERVIDRPRDTLSYERERYRDRGLDLGMDR